MSPVLDLVLPLPAVVSLSDLEPDRLLGEAEGDEVSAGALVAAIPAAAEMR